MFEIDVHDAARTLEYLLGRVMAGGEVVITRDCRPMARLVCHHEREIDRVPGLDAGLVRIHEDFDAPITLVSDASGGRADRDRRSTFVAGQA